MKLHLATLTVLSLATPAAAAQSILYQYHGSQPDERLGEAMAIVGDLNADGFTDFVVGAPGSPGTPAGMGSVNAYSGRTGTLLYSRQGTGTDNRLGFQLAKLGDINADGTNDYLAASWDPGATGPNGGLVQVLSGVDGAALVTVAAGAPYQQLSISGLGDLNNDSIPDFIIGIPTHSGSNGNFSGRYQIHSGTDGSLIRAEDGGGPNDNFGRSVQGLDDINGDGISDYAVGAPQMDEIFTPRLGYLRVYSGADGTQIYSRLGTSAVKGIGRSLGVMGDLNSDGIPELLVGVHRSGFLDGAVQVLSGADGSLITEVLGQQLSFLGLSVVSAGDFDNDGTPDFAAGSIGDNMTQGRATIFNGATGAVIATLEGSTVNSFNLGGVMAGGEDLDGDGFAEVIVQSHGILGPGDSHGQVVVLKRQVPNGGTLCKGVANSTGQRAILTAVSPSNFAVIANDVTLDVTQLPQNSLGYFIVSSAAHIIPGAGGSSGRLCIASLQFGRYAGVVLNSGMTGAVSFDPDTTTIPVANSMGASFQAVAPGSVFNFQFWYRHPNGQGGTTSNFSDAVTMTFQ